MSRDLYYKFGIHLATISKKRKELAYAIDNNGKVYSWRRGNSGQIGNDTFVIAQKIPVEVRGLSDIDKIIANTIYYKKHTHY